MAIDSSTIFIKQDKNMFNRLPQTKIAKYTNVSMEWLLTGKEPKVLSAIVVREAEVLYEPTATINIITIDEHKKLIQNQCSAKACVYIHIILELFTGSDTIYK